jgi:hypothetical protein
MTLLCSFSRRPRSCVRGITGTSSPPESLVKRQHGSCETEIGHFWGGWIGSGSLYLLRIYIARLLQSLVVAVVGCGCGAARRAADREVVSHDFVSCERSIGCVEIRKYALR